MKRYLFPAVPLLCLGLVTGIPAIADDHGPIADHLADALKNCEGCHGTNGNSKEPDIPIIAGFSVTYLVDNMTAYREDERPCAETEYLSGDKKGEKTDMCEVAKELDEDETRQLAEYLAGVSFIPAKQDFDPTLAAKGKEIHDEYCEKCHADGGNLATDDAGILAGQWMPYMRETFKEYDNGDRQQPKKMKKKMKLDAEEFEALVHFYGSLQ